MTNKATSINALWKRLLAWASMGLIIAGLFGAVWLIVTGCQDFLTSRILTLGLPGLAFAALGILIINFRPDNRIGWLSLLIGVLFVVISFADLYALCGLAGGRRLPGLAYMAWLRFPATPIALIAMGILLPYWFPDGRFHSRRWERLGWFSLFVVGLFVVPMVFRPGPLYSEVWRFDYPIENPFGLLTLPSWLGPIIYDYGNLPMTAGTLLAILSLLSRWRSASGVMRQQLKWLAYIMAMLALIRVIGVELLASYYYREFFDSMLSTWMNLLSFTAIAVGIGLAVFKHRLFDIDLIIKRTLVYAILSATLALIYFATVTLLQTILSTVSGQQSPVVIVLSTLTIAALFSPLRRRIQDIIDRRFFRQKYDAVQTLAAFSQSARNEVDLDELTGRLLLVVNETMQPDSATLWLKNVDEKAQRDKDPREDKL